jgi:hypothetical protein
MLELIKIQKCNNCIRLSTLNYNDNKTILILEWQYIKQRIRLRVTPINNAGYAYSCTARD